MRVSVDHDDPGYRMDAHLFCVRLNGRYVPNTVTADDTAGVVICNLFDAAGQLVRDPEAPGRPLREIKRGHVEIVPPVAPGHA